MTTPISKSENSTKNLPAALKVGSMHTNAEKSDGHALWLDPRKPLIHRDLSWLQFNERVLEESFRKENPLFERIKFLGISATNLDEFFMIRFSSVVRSIQSQSKPDDVKDRESLERIRDQILKNVRLFQKRQEDSLTKLNETMRPHGFEICLRFEDLNREDLLAAQSIFEAKVLPFLPPPERFKWSNLQVLDNLQMAVIVGAEEWIPVPKTLPQALWVVVGAKGFVMFLDQALRFFLKGRMRKSDRVDVIRISRDGDFSVDLEEEDPESIPDIVRSTVRSRDRGKVLRIQWTGMLTEPERAELLKSFHCRSDQLFFSPITHNLAGLRKVLKILHIARKKDHQFDYPPMKKRISSRLKNRALIFESIRKNDILLHHPYDSFEGFVNWVSAAVADSAVIEIQMTVYRTDAYSPVIDLLKEAAKTKKVRVLIELRARFDELNNLKLTEELKAAGVEVGFGFGKLKLHAKVTLVTRMEDGVPFFYTHLSTGNYNSATARQYEDLAILTANQELGQDAKNFLDAVWDERIPTHFKAVVSAPTGLHRRMMSLIRQETEAAKQVKDAHIVANVNALVDDAIIENLYLASQAGVKVDLIVRGACSLIPGVPGLSDRIRVISVVDRFLEHSRIYYFKCARAIYLSSADWMTRNFFSRLEIAFPVLDPEIFNFMESVVIPAYLNDSQRARRLSSKGHWLPRSDKPINLPHQNGPMRVQFYFNEMAARHYAGTPLSRRI